MTSKFSLKNYYPELLRRVPDNLLTFCALAVIVLANAAPAQAGATSDQLLLRYDLSSWGEGQPVYGFRVFQDGHVEYEGRYNVRTKGPVNYTISETALKKVINTLLQSRLFDPEVRRNMSSLSQRPFFEEMSVLEVWLGEDKHLRMVFGWIRSLVDDQGSIDLSRWQSFKEPLMRSLEDDLGIKALRCPVTTDPTDANCN